MDKTCFRCEKILTDNNRIPIFGKDITVCKDCAEDVYEKCPACGKYACENDFIYAGDDYVCIWCISEKFILCPHCCNFFPADKVTKIHGYCVCSRCLEEYFQKCHLCHTPVEKDEMEDIQIKDNYEKICLKCWKENYFRCEDCNCTYPRQKAHRYRKKLFCDDCIKYIISDDILDGSLKLSSLLISNENVRNFVRFNTQKNNSGLLNEAFFEEGYADDYVGDGLDGKDNYIGDGLDE